MNWRIILAQHAAERAAAAIHRDLSRGLAGLATVSATAPFLGLIATVAGVKGSFRGIGSDRLTILSAFTSNLSDAIIPAAFGLAVAVIALAARRVFLALLDDFDAEMRNAIADFSLYLRRSAL